MAGSGIATPLRATSLLMLRALGRTAVALGRHAPALLAWYLAGESVRAIVIAVAAPIGPEQSPILALLLVPIAVLARLVAYIGMFLSIRESLPVFARSSRFARPEGLRAAARDFLEILLSAIVPFFVLYGLLGQIEVDLAAYQAAAARYSFGAAHGYADLGDQPVLVVTVIVVAFVLRQVLRHVGDRLPRIVGLLDVYLEATWVFVAVGGIGSVFASAVQWVQERQIVAWWLGLRESIASVWEGFRAFLDGLGFATPIAVQLILLPLAWLLIAGSVYTRSVAEVAEERFVPRRAEARARATLARLPRPVRHQLTLFRGDWEESYKPLVVVGRLILRAGIANVSLFLASYAVLYAAGQFLARGLVLLLGAHDLAFWLVWLPLAGIAAGAVVEPLRICLLGSAFDMLLERRELRRSVLVQRQPEAGQLPAV